MKRKICALFVLAVLMFSLAATAQASWLTDPNATVATSGDTITLSKDLFGYANYGVTDGRSDVLYTGESGSWSFDIGSLGINLADYDATVTISMVLDDHYSVAINNYSMVIDLLGVNQFSGATDLLGLVHGTPYGTTFVNWKSASFNSALLADPFAVSISNTSTNIASTDWIAFDTIKLELKKTTAVPEPFSMLLLGTGLLGIICFRRKMK